MDSGPDLLLRTSVRKAVLLTLVSAIFVTGGILMLGDDPVLGWASIAFFGLGMIVGLVMLVPGASSLHLTADGFEQRAVFSPSEMTPWRDIERFVVYQVGVSSRVGFMYADGYDRRRPGRAVARALSGVEGALADTYGMRAGELAELMNRWLAASRRGDLSPGEWPR